MRLFGKPCKTVKGDLSIVRFDTDLIGLQFSLNLGVTCVSEIYPHVSAR